MDIKGATTHLGQFETDGQVNFCIRKEKVAALTLVVLRDHSMDDLHTLPEDGMMNYELLMKNWKYCSGTYSTIFSVSAEGSAISRLVA